MCNCFLRAVLHVSWLSEVCGHCQCFAACLGSMCASLLHGITLQGATAPTLAIDVPHQIMDLLTMKDKGECILKPCWQHCSSNLIATLLLSWYGHSKQCTCVHYRCARFRHIHELCNKTALRDSRGCKQQPHVVHRVHRKHHSAMVSARR